MRLEEHLHLSHHPPLSRQCPRWTELAQHQHRGLRALTAVSYSHSRWAEGWKVAFPQPVLTLTLTPALWLSIHRRWRKERNRRCWVSPSLHSKCFSVKETVSLSSTNRCVNLTPCPQLAEHCPLRSDFNISACSRENEDMRPSSAPPLKSKVNKTIVN